MKWFLHTVDIQTTRDTEFINVTDQVRRLISDAHIKVGIALVSTMHTTTAITVNEGLPDLEDDLATLLTELVPANSSYRHARFVHSDGQTAVNAPSHLRSALLGMQALFPVEDGQLVTGGRQAIYFVELDGPQHRQLLVQVLGE